MTITDPASMSSPLGETERSDGFVKAGARITMKKPKVITICDILFHPIMVWITAKMVTLKFRLT